MSSGFFDLLALEAYVGLNETCQSFEDHAADSQPGERDQEPNIKMPSSAFIIAKSRGSHAGRKPGFTLPLCGDPDESGRSIFLQSHT